MRDGCRLPSHNLHPFLSLLYQAVYSLQNFMLPNCCRRSRVSPSRIADSPFLPSPEPPTLIQHNPPSLHSYPYLPITYSQGNIPKSNIAPPPPPPLSKHSLPPKPISPNFAAAPLPLPSPPFPYLKPRLTTTHNAPTFPSSLSLFPPRS